MEIEEEKKMFRNKLILNLKKGIIPYKQKKRLYFTIKRIIQNA